MASRNYLSFDDMCWPNPDPDEDFLTNVRYDPKPEQINYLLSVLGAYNQLVYDTQQVRNSKIARIRKHAEEGKMKVSWQDDPMLHAAAWEGIASNLAIPIPDRLAAARKALDILHARIDELVADLAGAAAVATADTTEEDRNARR